ncbi:sulfotransferase family protein [Tundrisphaera sp. TA3]|uniref:sulfotransferase family protein n=1 Tax=Tundrisphaera sp. TA3 TaxID=3435775 RepID=UPI003EBF108F
MNEPTIHLISGMPRSGSTLLGNILAQNPRFHATATSGIVDVLFGVRNHWDQLGAFKAMPDRAECEAAKLRVLRGILAAYHGECGKPVVFDKSRSWLAYLEMAEAVLGRPAKVLVPVRDLRDVLASFELLWRASAGTGQGEAEAAHFFEFQTVEGRCAVWTRGDQPVGLAFNRIKDALQRGFRDRMHFVRFEELTRDPARTLDAIYRFLGEDPFPHDFDRVEQATREDDRAYGPFDLHRIRSRVEPVAPRWPGVLGQAAAPYAGIEVW